MCDGSGSGTSTCARADSGPVRSTIWTARMARERISAIQRAPELHHGVGAPGAPALRVDVAAEAREGVADADVAREEDVRVAECAHGDVRRGPVAHAGDLHQLRARLER